MNKQEAITQKVNELGEAVRASKGSVMVSKTGEVLRTVIQEGVMLSCIMAASGVKADKEEVVEKEFNE